MTIQCGKLSIERYIGGELAPHEAEMLVQHSKVCSHCAARISRLETEREVFLQKHPFSSFTEAHAPIKQLPLIKRMVQGALRPALVPIYSLALIVMVIIPYMYIQSTTNSVRFKGTNIVTYIFNRDGTVHERSANDRFRAGDKIQILYSSVKKQYLSLMSIDASGKLSFYHPDRQSICSIPVVPGTSVPYPTSIELDATPGDELVLALFSVAPLSTDAVSGWVAARRTSGNNLNSVEKTLLSASKEFGVELSSILLKKE